MNTALRRHPASKSFIQHGFVPYDETDTQIYGNCPFCGKRKFYINKDTKAWDCKSCGKSGGFQTFLNEITIYCKENFTGEVVIRLSKIRGLKIKTLRDHDVGYNPRTDNYVIPVYKRDNSDNVWDIRIYKSGKLMSTHSCHSSIINAQLINECSGVLWLCEGEWDAMTMQEILFLTGREDDLAVGVPGALTFKADWISFFVNRYVKVLYDNDTPGQRGALKVFNNLAREAQDLKFLNWRETYKTNFDIRDLYKQEKKARKTLESIHDMLKDLPSLADIDDIMNAGRETQENKFTGEGIKADKVYDEYKRCFHIPDTSVIDVLYGTIIANRLPGDPLWLFLVAPSGMTKTEFMQSISDAPSIVSTTTLTAPALISGSNAGGDDPSLIPQLNGRVLTVKDFTTILNMQQQYREEVFGILRDAYDGEITKIFGNGVRRHYRSKFGIIAGVTPAIEVYMSGESALGERFLRFEISLPSTIDENITFLKRAIDNITKEDEVRLSLKDISNQCLSYNFTSENIDIPQDIRNKILYLSMFTALMRSTIVRDKYSKEVTHKPFTEIGTRLSKQFIKLLMGILMFRRKSQATDEEYNIIKKVALSTAPRRLEVVVRGVYKRENPVEPFQSNEVSDILQLPKSTADRMLENLYMINVLKKNRLSSLKTDYEFTGDALKLITRSEVYK